MNKHRTGCWVLLGFIAFSLMALVPQQTVAQTAKGIELYNSWDYQEAEKVLRGALKVNPQDIRANFYLGLSILLQEKYKEALDIFQKIKEDQGKTQPRTGSPAPNEYQIQIGMARAHLGLKQYPEAWQNLGSAMKIDAHSADIYVYRGAYYIQQEKPLEAIKELEKAIARDAQNVYAHYYAGQAYLRSGNPARAVDMFKIFLKLAPRAPEAVKAKALIDALC